MPLGRWASGGNYWGGGVNWGGNNINVNRPININNIKPATTGSTTRPTARACRYSNANVQQKFGNNNIRAGSQERMDFRGRGGEQVLKPRQWRRQPWRGDGGQPAASDGATDRPGKRPARRNRPGGAAAARNGLSATGPAQSGRPAARQARQRHRQYSIRQSGQCASRARAGKPGRRWCARQAVAATAAAAVVAVARWLAVAAVAAAAAVAVAADGAPISALKHDIVLLGRLDNGLGFYRFSYNGSDKAYVGVMAQEVQTIMPEAVVRGRDGYLRVYYDKLGLKFETYDHWVASGARIPSAAGIPAHANAIIGEIVMTRDMLIDWQIELLDRPQLRSLRRRPLPAPSNPSRHPRMPRQPL